MLYIIRTAKQGRTGDFIQKLNPTEWLEDYYRTYVERDVRLLLNVGDLNTFDRFVRLCAGRVGQLINYDSLASDAGISQPTAKAWLSVLQTSYFCFLLEPHYRNFSKRIISKKLYKKHNLAEQITKPARWCMYLWWGQRFFN